MKFGNFMNLICDHILYAAIIFVCMTVCLRCSSIPQTTIDLQSKAEQTERAIEDGANGCKSLQCQDAMTSAKNYIRDSLETVKSRDNQIVDLQKSLMGYQDDIVNLNSEIEKLEKELIPWRTIKRWFYYSLAALIALFFAYVAYRFRSTIFELLKAVLKLS